MDPNNLNPNKTNKNSSPVPIDTEEQETTSDRVFDFSNDTISPVNEDEPVPYVPIAANKATPLPPSVPVKPAAKPFQPIQTQSFQTGAKSVQTTAGMKPAAASPGFTQPSKENVKPYIAPDVDLLDKKIGTFDASPFAKASPSAPTPQNLPQENIIPKSPLTTPPVVQPLKIPVVSQNPTYKPPTVSVPNKTIGDSYREPIDVIRGASQQPPKSSFVREQDQTNSVPMRNVEQTSVVANKPPLSTAPAIKISQVPPIPANLPVNNSAPDKVAPVGPTILKPSQPASIPLADIRPFGGNIKKNTLQEELASVLAKKPANPIQRATVPLVQDSTQAEPTNSQPQMSQDSEQNSDEKNSSQEIKSMRTYESDVADVMSHKRTSKASIAIAESTKRSGEEKISDVEPSHAGKKFFLFLLSLIFIGGGAIGAYYLYTISPLAPSEPRPPQEKVTPSIIPRDSQVVININDDLPLTIQSKIQNEMAKEQAPNTIKEIILASKDSKGSTVRVTGPEMIQIMDISAPDTVVRSLAADWMLGIYSDSNSEKVLFVAATTNFFQNAFSGMLQWESVMADDIRQYLYPSAPRGIVNVPIETSSSTSKKLNPLDNLNSILPLAQGTSTVAATTTATSSAKTATSTVKTPLIAATSTNNGRNASTTIDTTPPLQQYFTLRGTFEDRIVKNKDVREFRTIDGQVIFLYSFVDNSHLVVTGSEAALAEILSRLEKQSLIR